MIELFDQITFFDSGGFQFRQMANTLHSKAPLQMRGSAGGNPGTHLSIDGTRNANRF